MKLYLMMIPETMHSNKKNSDRLHDQQKFPYRNRANHKHLAVLELVISATLAAFAVVQSVFNGGISAANTGLATSKSY